MKDKAFGDPVVKHKAPAKLVFVKLEYERDPRRIPATHAEELHGGGSLVVYDGKEVVARFTTGIQNWWIEEV
jgi:hypothetical protein